MITIGSSKQLSKFQQKTQRKNSVNWNMEHFSIMVSFNQHQSYHISQSEQREISQSQSESRVESHKSLEARENASDYAAIFLSFEFD